MDDQRFDRFAKTVALSANRRSILKGVVGLATGVTLGSAVASEPAEAARRPTPTPKPVQCPGVQRPVNGKCTCPPNAPNPCGPDCCPAGASCCDNACCYGECYGEELCCPTASRGSGGNQLPPTHQLCTGTGGTSCCRAIDACCLVDGCCETICSGGASGNDYCCSAERFCPGASSAGDLCCATGQTCCGAGAAGNTCVDLTNDGCCSDVDCSRGGSCADHTCIVPIVCAPGYILDVYGMCIICAAGTYTLDGITCVPCARGASCDPATGSCPSVCEPGYMLDQFGMCVPCSAGAWSDGNACVVCECGANCDPTSGACQDACLPGTMPRNPDECIPCYPGSYSTDGGFCIPCNYCYWGCEATTGVCNCGEGWAPQNGELDCSPCPAGTFSTDSVECLPCDSGTFSGEGSYACAPCACSGACDPTTGVCLSSLVCQPGSMIDGADACRMCDPSTYSTDGTNCEACPSGTWTGTSGSTSCMSCGCGGSGACSPISGACLG